MAAAAQGTPSKDIEHWQHLAQRSAIPGQHNPYNTPIISLDSCHVLKLCWLLISSCLPAFRPQPRTQHLPQHNFSHTAMLHLLNSKGPMHTSGKDTVCTMQRKITASIDMRVYRQSTRTK